MERERWVRDEVRLKGVAQLIYLRKQVLDGGQLICDKEQIQCNGDTKGGEKSSRWSNTQVAQPVHDYTSHNEVERAKPRSDPIT